MFHRRLIAVGVLIALAFVAIGARLATLTISEGPEHLADAESRLGRSRLLPTIRGRILDRKDRVVAEDTPAYGMAVEYEAIDGTWVRREARRMARDELGRSTWGSLTPRGRELSAESRIPAAQRRLDAVLDEACTIAGIARRDLDPHLAEIRDSVSRRAEVVRSRQREQWIARYGAGSEATFKPEPIGEERGAHEVVGDLSDGAAFALRRLADAAPGVLEVTDSVRRIRPWGRVSVIVDRSTFPAPLRRSEPITIDIDGVADAIVGRCGTEVWREDLERRPFDRGDGSEDLGGYRPGSDIVGRSGVERAFENVLRGRRGRVTTRLDSAAEERLPAEPGTDVRLALDMALQARVEAILDPRAGLTRRQPWHDAATSGEDERPAGLPAGTPLASAAVVIDVDRGEILACASWPPPGAGEALGAAESARLRPGMHRALEGIYSPGSILKPFVYLAATGEGVFPIDGAVTCTGHYFPENQGVARCWIYRPRYGMATHSDGDKGPLGAEAALARSCNIFFYTLAQKLGPERLTAWLRRFGLGERPGTGLARPVITEGGREVIAGESDGVLPNAAVFDRIRASRDALTPIILGIGQGPIAWTPLQAANAYAAIAREGIVQSPILVTSAGDSTPVPHREDLELPPRAVAHALEGLRQGIEASYGTANHLSYEDGTREPIFDIPGISVRGKTGTAQAPPLQLDDDGDGRIDRSIKDLDHAWFAGLVGDGRRERPRYAIAVIVEYGGSGGKVAGPLAAQVVRALVAEGHLVGDGAAKEEQP